MSTQVVPFDPEEVTARILDTLQTNYLLIQSGEYHSLDHVALSNIHVVTTKIRIERKFDNLMNLARRLPKMVPWEGSEPDTDPIFRLWKVSNHFDMKEHKLGRLSWTGFGGMEALRLVAISVSWPVIGQYLLKGMLEHSDKFIDFGAGSGYLAHKLSCAGAKNVVAVDNRSDGDAASKFAMCHPCEDACMVDWAMTHASTGVYDDHALIFSWARCSYELEEVICHSGWNGDTVMVLGDHGNPTDDDYRFYGVGDPYGEFRDTAVAYFLTENKDSPWKLVKIWNVPRWRGGVRDSLFIYKRIHK